MSTPDSQLLVDAQSGDRAALEALIGRWWSRIRRWALVELGDPALAEDAAQEAVVKLCRTLERADPSRPLGPYLSRITRNAARDLRRRRGAVAESVREIPMRPRHDRKLDFDRGAKVAMAAFASLTPRQRQVIDAIDHQGLSADEVAAMLDIRPATVRVLLHQARRALRATLLKNPEWMDLLRSK